MRRKRVAKRRVVDERSVGHEDEALSFSFKRLECDQPLFPLDDCSAEFLFALLRTMQYYGEMPLKRFVNEDDAQCRHTIVWEKTNAPDGFARSKPDDIGTDVAWQFGLHDLEGNARWNGWRVHGFILDTTFYVVWLDPNHALEGTDDEARRRRNRG